ncbi:MAG TPA: hypothetical protein VHB50_15685 [Bryobacteraceae bacterium]|nr:hypothetical protein [Bryobacteraceae bacterium]
MPTLTELRSVVERFIAAAGEPAVLDPGEEPLRLIPEQWSASEWNGRLVLQAWDADRNFVRKITGLKEERRERLMLVTERFPKAEGELQIADLAAPRNQELQRRASRIAFRDRFRFMLAREFPEWRIEEISAETNLEQSLTPSWVRAFLRLGPAGMAAMAAPPDTNDHGRMVAFGLIWLDYLRQREKTLKINRLLLYAPAHRESEVAIRAALIDRTLLDCQLYIFDERDRVGAVDFKDIGNAKSTLPPCRRPVAPNSEAPLFPDLPDVERVEQSDGGISLRVKGLEFARWSGGRLTCGITRRKPCTMETVSALARELVRVRDDRTDDRRHPLYSQFPEGWLESQVRANPQAIDASLLPAPIYGQVPIFGGADRGVIDLLGIDHTGRLVVIELKITADPELPFQALDYWVRVREHLTAGDFERLGYFPGIRVVRESPRILLVAPALEFHSTSEIVLRFLQPGIDITRIGLAANWRRELRVMFRLRGAEQPAAGTGPFPPG